MQSAPSFLSKRRRSSRGESLTDSNTGRKDALLSGPLPSTMLGGSFSSNPLSASLSHSFEGSARRSFKGFKHSDSAATCRAGSDNLPAITPLDEEGQEAQSAPAMPTFDHCYQRVLRPQLGYNTPWRPEELVYELTSMVRSANGDVIVAGGKMTHNAGKNKAPALAWRTLGWVNVWQLDDKGRWRRWDAGTGHSAEPVSSVALLGDILAVGHAYEPQMITPGALARSGKGAGGSGATHGKEQGCLSLWRLNVASASLEELNTEHDEGELLAGVTKITWLENRVNESFEPEAGSLLAVATQDGAVHLWRFEVRQGAEQPMQRRTLVHLNAFHLPGEGGIQDHGKITDMDVLDRSFHGEGDMLLATSTTGRAVHIWQFLPESEESVLPHFAEPRKLPHPREVLACKFRQVGGASSVGDADLLITACMDYNLRLWDIDNEVCIRQLQSSNTHFTRCGFSLHGNIMVAGCQNGSLLLFDTHTGLRMRTMTGHGGSVTSVHFLPNSDGILISASADGTVRLWETKSGPEDIVTVGDPGSLSTVYSVAFTRDATRLVSGHRDSSVRVSSAADGSTVHRMNHQPGPTSFVFDVSVHPTEDICASACHDGTVQIWQLRSGKLVQVIENQSEPGEPKEISCVAFHPSGKWMSIAGFNRKLMLYVRNEAAKTDRLAPDWVMACYYRDHTNRIWVQDFSSDGAWLATGAWDGHVNVYRVAGMDPVQSHSDGSKVNVSYSVLPCQDDVWAAKFRPSAGGGATLLATGAKDSKIRLWGYDGVEGGDGDWAQIVVLEGHANTVTDIAWHPKGHMLASTSFDKTVRLWAGTSGGKFVPYGIWASYSMPAMAIAWSYQHPEDQDDSGSMIAIATFKGSIYLMDATDACQRFVPFSRAQHVLENAGAGAMAAITDIFSRYPETMTCLGRNDSGILLLWGIINRAHDQQMLPFLLDSARDRRVSPLLPYSPQNIAILTRMDYQLVAAIIDTIVQMHEAGDETTATLLSTGYGTLSVLQLIANYPDQAVVLLNHFGIIAADDKVYGKNWNPHNVLVDGVSVHPSPDPEVTSKRAPEGIWDHEGNDDGGRIRQPGLGWQNNRVHTLAAYTSLPSIVGMPPEEWHTPVGVFRSDGHGLNFRSLESSFLHVAYNSNDPMLFHTALGRAIIQWKWNAYGRTFYSCQIIFFALQLVTITAQAIVWGQLYRTAACDLPEAWWEANNFCPAKPAGAPTLGMMVILLTTIQLLYELYQVLLLGGRYVYKFNRSSFHIYDIVLLPLLMAAGVTGWMELPVAAPSVTSVAVFAAWLKTLYFARAFSSTGGLVRLIAEISFEMRYMMMLVGIGLAAATFAFYTLPPQVHFDADLNGSMENVWEMIFYTFSVMLAAYEVPYTASWLTQAITLVFLLYQAVLLLNALIALMSDTTEKVKENIKVIALRERAGLLLEMELVLGKRVMRRPHFVPRWLHLLVPDSELKGGGGDALGLKQYKQDLAELADSMARMMDAKMKEQSALLAEQLAAAMPAARPAALLHAGAITRRVSSASAAVTTIRAATANAAKAREASKTGVSEAAREGDTSDDGTEGFRSAAASGRTSPLVHENVAYGITPPISGGATPRRDAASHPVAVEDEEAGGRSSARKLWRKAMMTASIASTMAQAAPAAVAEYPEVQDMTVPRDKTYRAGDSSKKALSPTPALSSSVSRSQTRTIADRIRHAK